jgi:hypothetical protein
MGPKGIIGVSIKRGFSQPGQDTRPPPIESGPGWREKSPRRTKMMPEAPPRPMEWHAPNPRRLAILDSSDIMDVSLIREAS